MGRMAGVAVAAVMGACALAGGVERAEAATYEITGTGMYMGDNFFGFDVVYDPLNRFNANATFGYVPLVGHDNSQFTDENAHIEIKQTKVDDSGRYYDLSVTNPDYSFTYQRYSYSTDTFTKVDQTGYTLKATLYFNGSQTFLQSIPDSPYEGFAYVAFGSLFQPAFDGALVTTVPLPTALPLFGAGLLLLCGAAFVRRQRWLVTPPPPQQG